MTAPQVRLVLGLNILAAIALFVFAVFPVMDAHGWVNRPEFRIDYPTDETTP